MGLQRDDMYTFLAVVHDFTLPAHRSLQKVRVVHFSLIRSFYLLRHQGDQRIARMNRLAKALCAGLRAQVHKLEHLT